MREKQGSGGAKARIHLICAIVALLCVAIMFVPTGRERGWATHQVLYLGEMQFGISHATSGFDSDQPVYKIAAFAMIVAAALLIGWAVRSFQGKSGGTGLVAAVVNLLASAFVLMIMAVENGAYLLIIPTVILIALLAVAALVLAIRETAQTHFKSQATWQLVQQSINARVDAIDDPEELKQLNRFCDQLFVGHVTQLRARARLSRLQ